MDIISVLYAKHKTTYLMAVVLLHSSNNGFQWVYAAGHL